MRSIKLYDVKTAITAADLLNDRVLPFLRGARHRALAGADRSRQRILRLHEVDAARRQSGATRVRALSGDRKHRPLKDEDQEPPNEWDLRAPS
jgi:hypothetical protein